MSRTGNLNVFVYATGSQMVAGPIRRGHNWRTIRRNRPLKMWQRTKSESWFLGATRKWVAHHLCHAWRCQTNKKPMSLFPAMRRQSGCGECPRMVFKLQSAPRSPAHHLARYPGCAKRTAIEGYWPAISEIISDLILTAFSQNGRIRNCHVNIKAAFG